MKCISFIILVVILGCSTFFLFQTWVKCIGFSLKHQVTWKIWPIIWRTSYPFQVEDEIAKSNSLHKTIIVGFYVYKIGMVKHFALMPPKFLIRQLVLKLILTIGQHLVYLWTCLSLSYKMIFLLQVCTQHKQIQPFLFTKQQVLSIHSQHQTGKLLLPGYSKDGL